ncbi:MAG: 5-(carboxyamino)imidazole ribonucleotide synthase [Caulobacteraceae bacterium]|nr:5-(carboxyamino)imidazole ribonucleotide synthase [Caulobacteraceae bacterium]
MSAFPLPPGSTIGILGGGQLGRMLCQAASRLGFDTAVLTPRPHAPDARVAAHSIVAPYTDGDALEALAAVSDVITFEFENVPAEALNRLAAMDAVVAPGSRALSETQDRVVEKTFLNRVGCATVAFAPIDSADQIPAALERIGAPALLKTRREGYDGKGQAWVRAPDDAAAAFPAIGGKPAILEARADFVRELSVIAARGRDGQVACYPVGENRHDGGILHLTRAPAPGWQAVQPQAEAFARRVLEGLDYVGVLGVELFAMGDGSLLVNEVAPRVHNSGHWTQDGAACDQFEQHIRAVAGWPLGDPRALFETEMQNLLGDEAEAWETIAAEPGARLHLYGKGEIRPGRKMGHVNRLGRAL